MRLLTLLGLGLLGVGFVPIVGLLLMAALARLGGCPVRHNAVANCRLLGLDLTGTLNALGQLGWFVPPGLPLIVIGIVTLGIALVTRPR